MTELESLHKQHSDIDHMFDKSNRNINAHSVISIKFARDILQNIAGYENDVSTIDLVWSNINELNKLLK